MAKYLFEASYTAEGAKGVLKSGGSDRRAAINDLVGGLGGSVECVYWGFGSNDAYVIVDLPDHESAVACSMLVGASGAARVRTVVLLTAEQLDDAAKKSSTYRAPGK